MFTSLFLKQGKQKKSEKPLKNMII